MKIRNGFVSNSSSSSFIVVPRNEVEVAFLRMINEAVFNKFGEDGRDHGWSIRRLDNGNFDFYTGLDNFDMYTYVESFGLDIRDYEQG